jgi:hypothetical protein
LKQLKINRISKKQPLDEVQGYSQRLADSTESAAFTRPGFKSDSCKMENKYFIYSEYTIWIFLDLKVFQIFNSQDTLDKLREESERENRTIC